MTTDTEGAAIPEQGIPRLLEAAGHEDDTPAQCSDAGVRVQSFHRPGQGSFLDDGVVVEKDQVTAPGQGGALVCGKEKTLVFGIADNPGPLQAPQ